MLVPTAQPLERLRACLPRGRTLPADVWNQRHRFIVALLWAHAAGIALYALARGYGAADALVEGGTLALAGLLALTPRASRGARSAMASAGLLIASGLFVHLSGGYVEAHFHFFVMVAVIALYQDWLPYLVAIGFVVLHHGVIGVLDPHAVYNHPAAWEHPWRWAAIHGGFVLAASAASVAHWRFNERAQAQVVAERAARVAAEGEARLREEFISTAAHELKTPLTTVKVTAQLLSRRLDDPSDEVRRLSDQLHGQIGRLETLIGDLLDVSRIQQGRLEVRRERCDLTQLARAALEDVAETLPPGSRHRLTLDAAGSVIGHWDRPRIEQVLVNLVSNAIKYSPGGGEVRVSVAREAGGARLVVRDDGIGIAPERRAVLFEPFAGANALAGVESTGLGLSIARGIVEQHGGCIEVASTPGQGSVFTVTLPDGAPRS